MRLARLSLEGTLAIFNALVVGWLYGFDGLRVIADAAHHTIQMVSGPQPRDLADTLMFFAVTPFVLPVGWFGSMMFALSVHTIGTQLTAWFWFAVNAILWGEMVAFGYRILRTGNFRYARAEAFRWSRRPVLRKSVREVLDAMT